MIDARRSWAIHTRALLVEGASVLLLALWVVAQGRMGLGQGEGDLRPVFVGVLVCAGTGWSAVSTGLVALLAPRASPGLAVLLAHALGPIGGLMLLAPAVLLLA